MDYSTELEFGVDRFLEILTDYEKLPEYLPRQLQRIEIVDKDDNYTIIKAVILLRSLIKHEFILEIKIENNVKLNLSSNFVCYIDIEFVVNSFRFSMTMQNRIKDFFPS